ncbi:MAG: ABC transporter ATP-binding protein [Planctomycetes bacterium]|nr:ABC transporter ATP-binding protein [Planctomycetota bacterium]
MNVALQTPPVALPKAELPKLSIAGVSKSFGDLAAVTDVSLDIRRGEFLALVGPSGCGKTTILQMLAGFEKPERGQILIDGRPVTGPGPDRLVLFQEPALLPWLNVADNVGFGLPAKPRELREETIHLLLRMVHLEKFAHLMPHQLSGGMKQRAALARALAVDPQVLLMDEPFAALDPQTREILHHELQSLWLGIHKTVVFVTHSVEEAVRLADRIAVMATQPGRIRRVIDVDLPHPRDFNSPEVAEIRAAIRDELREELQKIARKEGNDEYVF